MVIDLGIIPVLLSFLLPCKVPICFYFIKVNLLIPITSCLFCYKIKPLYDAIFLDTIFGITFVSTWSLKRLAAQLVPFRSFYFVFFWNLNELAILTELKQTNKSCSFSDKIVTIVTAIFIRFTINRFNVVASFIFRRSIFPAAKYFCLVLLESVLFLTAPEKFSVSVFIDLRVSVLLTIYINILGTF